MQGGVNNNKQRTKANEFQTTAEGDNNINNTEFKEKRIFSVGKYKNSFNIHNNKLLVANQNPNNREIFNSHKNKLINTENSKTKDIYMYRKIAYTEPNNLNKKSKSVTMFKIKTNENLSSYSTIAANNDTNNIEIKKNGYNNNNNIIEGGGVNANSTKYKNLDLDYSQNNNNINSKGSADNKFSSSNANANHDIIENLNRRVELHRYESSSYKPLVAETVDVVNHENQPIDRKERQERKEIRLSKEDENFVITKKEEFSNAGNNMNNNQNNISNSILQNGRNLRSKNGISNHVSSKVVTTRNSELILCHSNAKKLFMTKNNELLNNKNRNNYPALGSANTENNNLNTNRPMSNNNINANPAAAKENNFDDVNSLSLSTKKCFILIGGYPAIREALLKRNWTELADNEK